MPRFIQPRIILFVALVANVPLVAQTPARKLVADPIDETKIVSIHGTVLHPLAQPGYDVGVVPDSLTAKRILLVLQRPAERESQLRRFLRDVQRRGSSNYHRWLTPQQFGQRFGPAESDIQTAVGWLQSHGLNVARVASSKTLIEFSGTVGQLRGAFHTEIHEYAMNGESHYANATDISIPAALAPLVRGTSPLNDFARAKPLVQTLGAAAYNPATKTTTPEWTLTNGSGNFYALAPEDFATQYDLKPLYQTGVNGAGQTIGIVNESNIDLSLVSAYQQLFGLQSQLPQVVVDGNDPGTLYGVDVEAYLDVQVSGAVAPNATVNLYISDGGVLFDPLVFAALRAIEDNQAGVLSVSFGACEQRLGQNGNQLFAALWEQAAAQGQTVFVSSGDSGSAGCDGAYRGPAHNGLGVNGLSSTPWNIAVGGTDFYYSDYASGAPSAATLWNQTNDSNNGSLIAPLPEQPWDDFLGLNVLNPFGPGVVNDVGAGGGASSCAIYPSSGGCSGYPKPNWQIGTGVPSDGVRDIPDLSVFASHGANLSAYPICAYEGECVPDSTGKVHVLLVGGTSASSPAMAGIMALINQKYGRQGQAGVVLYPLAQQTPSAFHDVTSGSNNVPCEQGTTDCSLDGKGDGYYSLQSYSAGPGYDQASGLGSVDANVLVSNWNSVAFLPTTTTLKLSSSTITHGQPVSATASVAPGSGSGTPTGDVALLTDSPLPVNQSQTFLTLNNGTGSASINFFPGGTYHVFGNYGGDDVFGSSKSLPVTVTVNPENTNVNFEAIYPSISGAQQLTNGGTRPYGWPLTLSVQPAGVNAPKGTNDGVATGTAVFKFDSSTETVPLEGIGFATWALPALTVGSHTVSGTYSGDNSFNASQSAPLNFTVTPGVPNIDEISSIYLGLGSGTLPAGASLTFSIIVGSTFGARSGTIHFGAPSPLATLAPTGTVTACLGPSNFNTPCANPTYSLTSTLAQGSGANGQFSTAEVTFPNLAAGFYSPTFSYSGDANWQGSGLFLVGELNVISSGNSAPTTTTLSITPAVVSGIQTATFTGTVSGPPGATVAPTGSVTFYNNNSSEPWFEFNPLVPASGGATSSFTSQFNYSPADFWSNGANQITAVYSGDSNYLPSTSSPASITVTQPAGDFTLNPQLPQVLIKAGGSGSVGLNLSSLAGFNGVVNLTCASASTNVTCGVAPPSLTVNGSASAMATINVVPGAAGSNVSRSNAGLNVIHSRSGLGWMNSAGVFVFASFCLGGFTRRRRWIAAGSLILFAALLCVTSCGGGGQTTTQPPPPPPPTASNTRYYTVVVTGTADGMVHNSQIIVAVQ